MSVLASRPDQKTRALVLANGSRVGRAQFKRDLLPEGRRGALTVAEAILTDSPLIKTAYVWQVLQWVPRVAERTAARMMRTAGVSPWATAARLTSRQREALADGLRLHARSADWQGRARA